MKYENWDERLQNFLWSRAEVPFEWQQNDCCTFACDAIVAMTGEDPAYWFRGKYNNRFGAMKKLKQFAGGGLPEMADKVTQEFGYKEVATPEYGDVVLMKAPNEEATICNVSYSITLGLMCKKGYIAAPSCDGLTFFTDEVEILKAWRV